MTGALFKARIEKIAAGGAGLARIEGKSAFIEGSAPGEMVLCRITTEHRSWLQAELLEIIEPSQDRVQPACALWGKCGGCNLQHLNYAAQLAAKTAVLEEAFVRIGGFCPPQPIVFPSEPWEYRNRMQFHAVRQCNKGESDTMCANFKNVYHGEHGVSRRKKVFSYQNSVVLRDLRGYILLKLAPMVSDTLWGLKARKKGDNIPVSDCPIADPGIRAVLRDESGRTQAQLLPPGKDRFTVYARNGLFISEGGTSRGKTQILNRELVLDAGVFFQSNGAMLEKLVMDLREIIGGSGKSGGADRTLPMADIYCGVGTFAAFLGDMFPHVDLVEEHTTALALARENLTHLKSTAFFAQRSEQWALSGLSRRYGFICVDPPRQGLDPALARRLAAEGPPLLAYISCDPATLARDSKILVAGDYKLAELRYYDFYPQTAHIESLAIFAKEPLINQ